MREEQLTSNGFAIARKTPDTECFDDIQLVELLRLGDHEAFGVLARRYEKRLLRTAVRITKNQEDGEDAVQEALLKAYWRINSFRGDSSFSTWLTRIVINLCLMQLRKNRTRPHHSLDETGENGAAWVDNVRDPSVDIEAAYAFHETTQLLSHAISRLNPTLRCVVDGYQQYDCTMAELAERNNLSTAAVKSRLLRARIALKNSATMRAAR
jgi:RNA polymerase sigma-70 factor (ECF subfamily)